VEFHPSVGKVLDELKTRYPGAVFSCFGQTPFWDEPIKCMLAPMLDRYFPEATMLVGPHDADYFGRVPGLRRRERFVVCEHTDNLTRDMWAAAGELSAFLGGDFVPRHGQLARAGVDLQKITKAGGKFAALIKEQTRAWGWKAVVEATGVSSTCRDVQTKDVLKPMLALLAWGLRESAEACLGPRRDTALATADEIIEVFRTSAEQPDNSTLSRLFMAIWPYFYQKLIGEFPKRASVTSTSSLFRFNRQTCGLPRFQVVDWFVNPTTATICRRAYAAAVAGSGIYALDRFGEGALPFDLLVPGKGRGTLFLTPGRLHVALDSSADAKLSASVGSVYELAEAIEQRFGPDVSLVGKAVVLPLMFAAESVFVLDEMGSVYVDRTRQLAQTLAANGIPLALRPILRLRYNTWDSLRGVDAEFRLRAHLADAFGTERITASDFAERWRDVTDRQKSLFDSLGKMTSSLDMMKLLGQGDSYRWFAVQDNYVNAKRRLLNIQRSVRGKKLRAGLIREELKALKVELDRLYKDRGKMARLLKSCVMRLKIFSFGEDERETLRRLREGRNCFAEAEMRSIVRRIDFAKSRVRKLKMERRQIVDAYRALEMGAEARKARRRLIDAEAEAMAERLRMASGAYRVKVGMPYSNRRPTAWWLILVDPEGKWFRNMTQTTEVYLEEILG